MRVTDVAAFVGPYPFRHLAHADSPEWLLRQMDRLRIERAWVGHLASFLYTDPAPGNDALFGIVDPHLDRLVAIPAVSPAQAGWERDLAEAVRRGAPAVRVYPQYAGVSTGGAEMHAVVAAAARAGVAVVLTVRFEDLRQRHPLDAAPDLDAAAIRSLARSERGGRLVVTHASRNLIEEVHFGLTPDEARRIVWDISWIWGPPEDDLGILLDTIGPDRFVLGTGMPLRIPDTAFTKLALLEGIDEAAKNRILSENLEAWLHG